MAEGRCQVILVHVVAGQLILADEGLVAASFVATVGLLHLDYAGPQFGQDHAGERAGQNPRQLDHGNAGERFHTCCSWRNARMRAFS
ncbi:hypothetical protein D3C81_1427410 [compost metagenome]